jgi:two-component system, chemotaxis family, chemotaxis protein CheY
VARVLIADDAAIVRSMMRRMLEEGGHAVVAEAANGREAVARFAEHRPDLAIVDGNMPVLDGFEAAAAIRDLDPDAMVVIASVHDTPARVQRASAVGAVFLRKPFDSAALLDSVAGVS